MHMIFLTGKMFNNKQGMNVEHHGQSVYREPAEGRGEIFNLPS
jgi:hypothetical protein